MFKFNKKGSTSKGISLGSKCFITFIANFNGQHKDQIFFPKVQIPKYNFCYDDITNSNSSTLLPIDSTSNLSKILDNCFG